MLRRMDLRRAAIGLVMLGLGCGSEGGPTQDSASGSASAGGSAGTTGSTDGAAPGSSGSTADVGGGDATSTHGGATTDAGSQGGADTSGPAGTGEASSGDSTTGESGTDDAGTSGGDLADGVLDVTIIAHDDCTFTVTPASITVPTGTEFTVNWVSSPASATEFDVAKIDAFNAVPIILGLEPGGSYHDEVRVWCGELFTGTFDFELRSCYDPTYIPVDCGG